MRKLLSSFLSFLIWSSVLLAAAETDPVLIVVDKSDIVSYMTATYDYRSIKDRPAVIAVKTGESSATEADIKAAWDSYVKNGDKRYENLFRYRAIESEFEGWDIHSKNMGNEPVIIKLWGDLYTTETSTEENTYNDFGEIHEYSKVTDPEMFVFLPDPEKATGTSILVCPGGAMVVLAWETELMPMVRDFVSKGIAVIGVKYRLNMGMAKAPGGPKLETIADYDPQAEYDNVGPAEQSKAGDDLAQARRILIAHAQEWNLDPSKIGFMGFSAGGGPVNANIYGAAKEDLPAFVCSIYAPVFRGKVPENAPKAFIAVHADHPNVAAKSLNMFHKWQEAGLDAEFHVYGHDTGSLFGVRPDGVDLNTAYGNWHEQLYSWLVVNGFTHVIPESRDSDKLHFEDSPLILKDAFATLYIARKGSPAAQAAANAYKNAVSPVSVAVYDEGCSIGQMEEAWKAFTSSGGTEYEDLFRYRQVEDRFRGWEVHSKNYSKEIVIDLLDKKIPETVEYVDLNEYGDKFLYHYIQNPQMEIRLPDADKANGTAVVIYPGGGMVSLAWEEEFRCAADFLNARGIAAIGVKYRTNLQEERVKTGASGRPVSMETHVYDYWKLDDPNNPANARFGNPNDYIPAIEDAEKAFLYVKVNASKWNIDPEKVGIMGFSAGGIVMFKTYAAKTDTFKPAFICSIYGPCEIGFEVPADAPKLFSADHTDHLGMAARCLHMVLKWKKAGKDAEIHLYSKGTGGLFAGGPMKDNNTYHGDWKESFHSWLVANGFTNRF